MKRESNYSTVILLINGESGTETDFAREWFGKSRFHTKEAADIFQAIEEISDFTTPLRPHIVLLTVDLFSEDFSQTRKIAQSFAGKDDISFMALSGSAKIINHKDCFEGDLAQLRIRLDEILPEYVQISAAA